MSDPLKIIGEPARGMSALALLAPLRPRVPEWMVQASCARLIEPCTDPACAHDHAGCAEVSSFARVDSLFFPTSYESAAARSAVKMCVVCPVWRECLTWAAGSPDSWTWGIYGGLLPAERKGTDLAAALALAARKRREAAAA